MSKNFYHSQRVSSCIVNHSNIAAFFHRMLFSPVTFSVLFGGRFTAPWASSDASVPSCCGLVSAPCKEALMSCTPLHFVLNQSRHEPFHLFVLFFELLIGQEYFHTVHEYPAVIKRPFFISWIKADFSKILLCEQMHEPITMTVQNRCHVCLPERQQRCLTSSLPVFS